MIVMVAGRKGGVNGTSPSAGRNPYGTGDHAANLPQLLVLFGRLASWFIDGVPSLI
jgi:hypothetical protein